MVVSAFVFGHEGRPSLTKTICGRLPLFRREPVKSWFKDIRDFPYGGWGFYARLHCRTYMFLTPVFSYASAKVVEIDSLSSLFTSLS